MEVNLFWGCRSDWSAMPRFKYHELECPVSRRRCQTPQGTLCRAGFSLIEMVVSLSVMSIVFLAMGSVMLLATKAIPAADAPTHQTLDTADVLRQFAAEIETAKTILSATPTGIEFTVPDRNNDASDETIKYGWSGTAGEPLFRQCNGGATVAVLPAVYEFDLSYIASSGTQPGGSSQSSEIELVSRVAVTPTNYAILPTNWIGQSFTPTNLPAGTESWNVTRVLLMAKSQGDSLGEICVQLRPMAAGGLPGTTVLEEYPIFESDLSSLYIWQNITFNSVTGLSPSQGLCLVVKWVGSDNAGAVQYDIGGGSGLLTSSNGGSTWSLDASSSMSFYVYGTFLTPGGQTPVGLLRTVTAVLNAGQTDASRVRTTTTMLNRPEMP